MAVLKTCLFIFAVNVILVLRCVEASGESGLDSFLNREYQTTSCRITDKVKSYMEIAETSQENFKEMNPKYIKLKKLGDEYFISQYFPGLTADKWFQLGQVLDRTTVSDRKGYTRPVKVVFTAKGSVLTEAQTWTAKVKGRDEERKATITYTFSSDSVVVSIRLNSERKGHECTFKFTS